jgi:glutamate-ammonia-ligase adenylyltransferase
MQPLYSEHCREASLTTNGSYVEALQRQEDKGALHLDPDLTEEIQSWLVRARVADPEVALERLQRIAATLSPDLLPHLVMTLADSAAPDRVLLNMERFVQSAQARGTDLGYLARTPRAIEILSALFAGSQFLTEILLRNPDYFFRLAEHRRLAQAQSADDLSSAAQACIVPGTPQDAGAALPATWETQLDALRRFQRWELLRIGTCDLLGLTDLSAVTSQLSHLADSLIQASLQLAAAESGTPMGGFAVIAMGKLGGSELNYSSDIDLLFVARAGGTRYQRLAEKLIGALSRVTTEGFLYRVDMRLRPWGEVGTLVPTVDGYLAYLERHGRLWEKQALIKARPVAGDRSVTADLLDRILPLLYGVGEDAVRSDVYAMKQRTEALLREQGRSWGEVKLGEGSIRDIEFVTQYLQMTHGEAHPEVRSRGTLDALQHLLEGGFLNPDEYLVLKDGYVFLRTIEHYLQMMHYRQTHTLPADDAELALLARRLGFQGGRAGRAFLLQYEQHRAAIRRVYLSYLGSYDMDESAAQNDITSLPEIGPHVARMDASYGEAFDQGEIRLHATLAEQLDYDHLVEVHAVPLPDGRWRVTIVGYDYPGELSLICGLLFVYTLDIDEGHVFTYEPAVVQGGIEDGVTPRGRDVRRKIVDVFTVHSEGENVTAATWVRYHDELEKLLHLVQGGRQAEAQGELVKRVSDALQAIGREADTLYPVEIDIDNAAAGEYTLLRISAPDTIGFLYEFTNALALSQVYIARVNVASVGSRVHDTLYVTDARGHKITSPERQRELRAATVLIKHFTHMLPVLSNPAAALLHFRQFIAELFRRPDWPDELTSLERPEVLGALAHMLGVSDFLWNDFLRMQHENLFPVVRDVDALQTAKSRDRLQSELEAMLRPVHEGPQPPSDEAPWRQVLNEFKDREMFRIDMRHILGHTVEFWDFSHELTDLAEVIVNAAYHLCHEDLRVIHGIPLLDDGRVSDMAVCALGKCGGRELGFASDIELMFVYAGNGRTTGPDVITTAEFYEKIVENVVRAIRAKREGIFEIDLQLRPYGKAGSMAVSLEAFRRYFAPSGPAWAYERQALVKLRPVAGNATLGQRIVSLRDSYVYGGRPFDVVAMRAMRERQIRHLVTGGTFNAKFSPGGLVDVEYLVQALQMMHGGQDPAVRETNIREAMAALAAGGILSTEDYARLRRAHTFLRWLIDGLRMVRGNAKDLTVPSPGSEAFAFLARRLRYGQAAELQEDLTHYTASVQELNRRLLST